MNCFEHVKIREFKAVCGKCQCCATLSNLRKTFKSQQQREYVTSLHAYHRSTYMVSASCSCSCIFFNNDHMRRGKESLTQRDEIKQSHRNQGICP